MQQDSKKLIKGLPRRIAMMLLDCGLIVLCYYIVIILHFDGEVRSTRSATPSRRR